MEHTIQKIYIRSICMKNKLLFVGILLLFSVNLYSEDSLSNIQSNNGFFLYYGIGKIGIRDEYISNEKYSGTPNCFGTYWSKNHGKYLYKLGIEYLFSNELRNNNITSKNKYMSLHQTYLYKTLNNKKSTLYIGPSVSISYLDNSPNIAGNSLNSMAGFLHLGIDGLFYSSFNNKLSFEIFSKLGILSFGSKKNNDDSNAKFESLFTNTYFNTKIVLNYQPVKILGVGLGYENHIIRMTSWDYYLGVSNNAFVFLRIVL
jgi:hypothetical protein